MADSLTPVTEVTTNSVLDALADDSDTDKSTSDKLAKSSTEDIKLDDIEVDDSSPVDDSDSDDLEEEDEEIKIEDPKIDELDYVALPSRQSILKAYPDIFKKFPGVERAMYREREYSNAFATVAEAKQAKERLEVLDKYEGDLYSGNLESILTEVKQKDSKVFGKMSGKILQTLHNVDKEAYYGTVNTVLQHALNEAVNRGKALGDDEGEQLTIAAKLLNKFLYGTTDVKAPANVQQTEEKEDPKVAELTKKEQEFNQRQLTTAVNEVTGRINTAVKSAVEKYIDPKGVMSDYIRTKAIADVLSLVDKEVSNDKDFRRHLDLLWQDSYKNSYSDGSKERIRNAFISKARTILPDVIKKVRADALKGLNAQPRKRKEENDEPETRRVAQPNNRSTSNARNGDKPKRVGGVGDVMKFLSE